MHKTGFSYFFKHIEAISCRFVTDEARKAIKKILLLENFDEIYFSVFAINSRWFVFTIYSNIKNSTCFRFSNKSNVSFICKYRLQFLHQVLIQHFYFQHFFFRKLSNLISSQVTAKLLRNCTKQLLGLHISDAFSFFLTYVPAALHPSCSQRFIFYFEKLLSQLLLVFLHQNLDGSKISNF